MRKWGILGIVLATALLLSSCGTGTAKVVDAQKLADDLKETLTFQDTLSQASDAVQQKLYGFAAEDVIASRVYISTGATAEEIAVLEATDEAAAKRVYELASRRVETQKAAFENYVPEEMVKLRDAVLVKKGRIVVLCITNEAETARKTIQDAL